MTLQTKGREILRLERRVSETRPTPPDEVGEDVPERFAPDAVFAEWAHDTFVKGTGPLANPDHEHLMDARIGVLWTNAINQSQMRRVLGTAEIPTIMGGAWKRGRFEQQLRDWFECEPHFVLTFYAPEVSQLDDRAFCALVEHELYHCGQAEDRYGAPKFNERDGSPIYAIRGHDVEEFGGVVARYGATTPELREMVRAANAKPLMGDQPITVACGTCRKAAA